MVLRHKAKHPPVSYSVGEKVLVKPSAKDRRVARGGHKLRRIPPQHGTVLDVDTTLHQYKVIVDGQKKWVRVEELASLNRASDLAKRQKQRQEEETQLEEKSGISKI